LAFDDESAARRAPSFAMQDFQKIDAWRRAHALSITIQKLVRRFGRAGFSQLRAQLNKSADGIPSNIVAGCNAETNREFAYSSANQSRPRTIRNTTS